MKLFKALPIAILLYSGIAFAQGNQGMGGMNNMNSMSGSKKPKANRARVLTDSAENTAAQIKKDLDLDELQLVAITNILKETAKSQENILRDKASGDATPKLNALAEATDIKIKELLYKSQKDRYVAFDKSGIASNQIPQGDRKDEEEPDGPKPNPNDVPEN